MIIAFGYSKRSGKDTSAKFLDSFLRVQRPGLIVKKVSFAAKVKDISCQLYKWAGLQPGVYYDTEAGQKIKEVVLPKIGMSPREIWIQLGNRMREVYSDTWLNYALLGIKVDVIIVSDLRFPNEANRVIDLGGWCYELYRPDIVKGYDAAEVALDSWDKWRGTIANDGTLTDLNTRIEEIGRELLLAL